MRWSNAFMFNAMAHLFRITKINGLKILNNIITYVPSSSDELINFAFKYKKILIAVNEKILCKSRKQTYYK